MKKESQVVPFYKMDGLGNDFMIVDERAKDYKLTAAKIRKLADRRTGVGFDQMIILRKAAGKEYAAEMKIFNADGSAAGACGNGTRCVGRLLMDEMKVNALKLKAPHGRVLEAKEAEGGLVTVNMGKPKTAWEDVPLAKSMNTLEVKHLLKGLPEGVAVNVGNPHIVFFVKKVDKVDLEKFGPLVENHELFPERVNVEFAEVVKPDHIKMRVWERGAGITEACGTGACAVLVNAVRKRLSARKARVEMQGGSLIIEWTWEGDIFMTGAAHMAFKGEALL